MAVQQHHTQEQQQVFHLFGLLPTEIRLEIWVHTWEPRTVTLFPINDGGFPPRKTRNRLPASAYVNTESRSETLRYYKSCFANKDKTHSHWFNFCLDTLCLASPWFELDPLDRDDLRHVQRLILPEPMCGVIRAAKPCRDTWPTPVTDSLESPLVEKLLELMYPNLREITLTTGRWQVRYNSCEYERKQSEYKGWGYMRTAYISGLKVRYSPAGSKTYEQRYCCRLSMEDSAILQYSIGDILWWLGA